MNILLVFFFASLVTLALIHYLSLEFFLYWKYLWLDIPVHILGGITVAFGIALAPFFRIMLPNYLRTFLGYSILVLCAGLGWEVFEYMAGISIVDSDFFADTLIDLCMDIVGAVIGYGIVQSIMKLERLS